MKNLKTKILDAVEKNNIIMIPKWKFVLYSALGIVGIIFSFLLLVFLFSLMLFVLSRYGFMYMPFFGFMHTLRTLSVVPPVLLVCTILLLVLIEIISRYYSFSFRRPLAVTLLLIVSFATVTSYVISETSMHEYVRGYAKTHRIDMMTRMYDRPVPFKPINGMDVVRGEVVLYSPTTTVLELFDGTRVIAYASTTGTSTFIVPSIGDDVVVLGIFNNSKFMIIDMRQAPPRQFGGHRNGMRKEVSRQMMDQEFRAQVQGGEVNVK